MASHLCKGALDSVCSMLDVAVECHPAFLLCHFESVVSAGESLDNSFGALGAGFKIVVKRPEEHDGSDNSSVYVYLSCGKVGELSCEWAEDACCNWWSNVSARDSESLSGPVDSECYDRDCEVAYISPDLSEPWASCEWSTEMSLFEVLEFEGGPESVGEASVLCVSWVRSVEYVGGSAGA